MSILCALVMIATFIFCVIRYRDVDTFRSGTNSCFLVFWVVNAIVSASCSDLANTLLSVVMIGFTLFFLEREKRDMEDGK